MKPKVDWGLFLRKTIVDPACVFSEWASLVDIEEPPQEAVNQMAQFLCRQLEIVILEGWAAYAEGAPSQSPIAQTHSSFVKFHMKDFLNRFVPGVEQQVAIKNKLAELRELLLLGVRFMERDDMWWIGDVTSDFHSLLHYLEDDLTLLGKKNPIVLNGGDEKQRYEVACMISRLRGESKSAPEMLDLDEIEDWGIQGTFYISDVCGLSLTDQRYLLDGIKDHPGSLKAVIGIERIEQLKEGVEQASLLDALYEILSRNLIATTQWTFLLPWKPSCDLEVVWKNKESKNLMLLYFCSSCLRDREGCLIDQFKDLAEKDLTFTSQEIPLLIQSINDLKKEQLFKPPGQRTALRHQLGNLLKAVNNCKETQGTFLVFSINKGTKT